MRRAIFPALLLLAAFAACDQEDKTQAAGGETLPPAVKNLPTIAPSHIVTALGEKFTPAVENVPGGKIDWTSGRVFAVGSARAKSLRGQDVLMAKRAARLLAARNAVLLMGGIRTGPGGKFSNVRSGQVLISATLRGMEEKSSRFDPATRTATVTLSMPLCGRRGVVNMTGMVLRKTGRKWRWGKIDASAPIGTIVIIDARGTPFSPCMYPRIQAPDGAGVFDATDAEIADVKDRGLAIYTRRSAPGALLDSPATRPVGDLLARPILLKAVAAKNSPGAVVLTPESVGILSDRPDALIAMRSGRLVIVTGPLPPTDSSAGTRE